MNLIKTYTKVAESEINKLGMTTDEYLLWDWFKFLEPKFEPSSMLIGVDKWSLKTNSIKLVLDVPLQVTKFGWELINRYEYLLQRDLITETYLDSLKVMIVHETVKTMMESEPCKYKLNYAMRYSRVR